MNRILATLVTLCLVTGTARAACNYNFDTPVCVTGTATFTSTVDMSNATLTTGAITTGGAVTTNTITGASATTLALGNTISTAASICNSAACDTITIGTNTDADTITIGDSTDTAVSITDDNWSVSTTGVGTFVSLATNTIAGGSATTLTLGDTISTAASLCNSAACDTVTIGTNTDADTITLGDWASDTVNVGGLVDRPKNGTTLATTDTNLAKATLQAARFFLVDTASNVVDVDFADDAALDAADVGSTWMFVKTGAGTNAMTVTAGASGVTTVTNHTIGAAATAEDIGDFIRCTAYTTTAILCEISAAD